MDMDELDAGNLLPLNIKILLDTRFVVSLSSLWGPKRGIEQKVFVPCRAQDP